MEINLHTFSMSITMSAVWQHENIRAICYTNNDEVKWRGKNVKMEL